MRKTVKPLSTAASVAVLLSVLAAPTVADDVTEGKKLAFDRNQDRSSIGDEL